MARAIGTFPFSANFETKMAGTLDSRQLVDDFADLLAFTSDNFIPNGFFVSVKGTSTPSERGIYRCVDNQNLSSADSWEKENQNFIKEEIVEPASPASGAIQFVIGGELKVKFANGVVKTLATNV